MPVSAFEDLSRIESDVACIPLHPHGLVVRTAASPAIHMSSRRDLARVYYAAALAAAKHGALFYSYLDQEVPLSYGIALYYLVWRMHWLELVVGKLPGLLNGVAESSRRKSKIASRVPRVSCCSRFTILCVQRIQKQFIEYDISITWRKALTGSSLISLRWSAEVGISNLYECCGV